MEKSAIKDLLYGGISELMRNNRYYHFSPVGKGYCRWTDEGKEALKDFVSEIAHLMSEENHRELDQRAKDMVIDNLKGK